MDAIRTLPRSHAIKGVCALAAGVGLLLNGSSALAQTAGDPAIGSKLFLQCRACHTVGANDSSGVGPNLYGVVGAKAAGKPGYVYSAGLEASGLVWTPANLDLWIKKPTDVVPTTKMAFAGVAAPKMRQDLIAYLSTLKAKTPQ
jgi:cytochrome c